MNIENLSNNKYKHIMDCEVKDPSGLNDYQKIPNKLKLSIPHVGIERFRIPLPIVRKDGTQSQHDCEASMFVYLEAQKTGVNMSRFCSILQSLAGEYGVDDQFFKTILRRFREELRDDESEKLIPQSKCEIKLSYPMKQPSLKSSNWGWQYYDCTFGGEENESGEVFLKYTLKYEYSSTCPCSLSMAKQYESDFKAGKVKDGNGIATAHSQRSQAIVEVLFKPGSGFHVEDLILLMRTALPTETQSLVKRVDEQAFAILNGENPMFVEHSSRRLNAVLNNEKRILDWSVKVEHFESLHSHNAVAYIRKSDNFVQ